jgi:DNA invertase Pin-like site-specific DNA recombinase
MEETSHPRTENQQRGRFTENSMTNRVKSVVAYCRVSTEQQAESGLSIEAQREQLVSFAIASGLELVGLFIDAGISGAKDESERPGLREALATITEGRADALVVSKRDRLARDMSLAGYIETTIRRAGGELIVLDEQDVSPITRCVMQMVAQIERELASQRTRLAMKALRDQGKHCGSTPYGYEIVNGRLEPKAGEIEIVATIVELREKKTQGKKMTLAEIAAYLTSSNVPTRRGGKWGAEQVRSILERAKTHGVAHLPANAA